MKLPAHLRPDRKAREETRALLGVPVVVKAVPKTSSKRQWELLLDSMPLIRSYIRRVVGDHDSAEEVMQEVVLQILISDGPVDDAGRFLAWSRGVARHVAAHHSRNRRRTTAELSLEPALEEAPDPLSDPESHVDARKTLARAARSLDEEGFELLVRRYVLGESGKELAGEFAYSPAALRMRLMRIRSSLRSGRA
jgi:RNA polymerase sigma factor (sigma-70 family)